MPNLSIRVKPETRERSKITHDFVPRSSVNRIGLRIPDLDMFSLEKLLRGLRSGRRLLVEFGRSYTSDGGVEVAKEALAYGKGERGLFREKEANTSVQPPSKRK